MNPNLLEDKLWQKDLSSKDFFKFDQCHTVQIGSFTTAPVPSGDMIICVHGIRMTVNNTSKFMLSFIIVLNHNSLKKCINDFFLFKLYFSFIIDLKDF